MKTLIFASVSLAALLVAAPALAGNNTTIQQLGTAQHATADQTNSSDGGVIQITQGLDATQGTDGYNQATATQGGSGNQATITQSQGAYGVANPSNTSTSDQEGVNGTVVVVQVGNNSSNISQGGSGEHALVGQANNFNTSVIVQAGVNELGVVNQQAGVSNVASISQAGTGTGVSGGSNVLTHGPGANQIWSEELLTGSVLPGASTGTIVYGPTGAVIDQNGSNHSGTINQAGYQNFADVTQGNQDGSTNDTGMITQGAGTYYAEGLIQQTGGSNNIATTNQQGSGSGYSLTDQNGSNNQAYANQVGNETSVIDQGYTGTIPTASGAVNGNYANVNQTSGNNTSLVQQTGNYGQAWVSQTAQAGATSTISQGGSYSIAVVRQ